MSGFSLNTLALLVGDKVPAASRSERSFKYAVDF